MSYYIVLMPKPPHRTANELDQEYARLGIQTRSGTKECEIRICKDTGLAYRIVGKITTSAGFANTDTQWRITPRIGATAGDTTAMVQFIKSPRTPQRAWTHGTFETTGAPYSVAIVARLLDSYEGEELAQVAYHPDFLDIELAALTGPQSGGQ